MRVNWELHAGETVEEFVAALLLLENPHGNRVTPSRGDRGVDIRVETGGGFAIYQVKRYTRPLKASQARSVEDSWRRFVDETLPSMPVESWNLVTPWDPSNERLEWLADLTSEVDFPVNWIGRSQLDGLAAERPSLVNYYFGDGGERLASLMASALNGAKGVATTQPGEALLEGIVDRQRDLSKVLNEVDPFYRYSIEIREGSVAELPWSVSQDELVGASFNRYTQIDEHRYSVLRIYPRCRESHLLRPITSIIQLEAEPGTDEARALERYLDFGTPLENVPGAVIESQGPPGTVTPGKGFFSFMAAQRRDRPGPELELRLVDAESAAVETLLLGEREVSTGPRARGLWLRAWDIGSTLRVTLQTGAPDKPTDLELHVGQVAGKTPGTVLPVIRFLAAIDDDRSLIVAVRDGMGISGPWKLGMAETVETAQRLIPFLEDLQSLQRHTFESVRVPELDSLTDATVEEVGRLARVLRGEQVEVPWFGMDLTVGDPSNMQLRNHDDFALRLTHDLCVQIGEQVLAIDRQAHVFFPMARLEEASRKSELAAGDVVRVVPAGESKTALMVLAD